MYAANGGTRYVHRSNSSVRETAHYELNQDQLDTDLESPRIRETSLDNERLIEDHRGMDSMYRYIFLYLYMLLLLHMIV